MVLGLLAGVLVGVITFVLGTTAWGTHPGRAPSVATSTVTPSVSPSGTSLASAGAATPVPALTLDPVQRLQAMEATTTLAGRSGRVVGAGPRRGLAQLAADLDAAASAVTAVVGRWRTEVVVLAPSDTTVMARLVGGAFSDPLALRQVAAVTTGPTSGPGAVVVVNVTAFASLTQVGRRIVLAHELTHVATRAAGGRSVAEWLTEGFADYVGFRNSGVPTAVAARDVVAAARAGHLPTTLPTAEAFLPAEVDTSVAYQQAWLACRALARRWGESALVALYRDAATQAGADAQERTERALRQVLQVSAADVVALWRRSLVDLAAQSRG